MKNAISAPAIPVFALVLAGAFVAPVMAQNSFNVGGAPAQGQSQPIVPPAGQLQPDPQGAMAQPQPVTNSDATAATGSGFGAIATGPEAAPPQPAPGTENNPELVDYGVPPTSDLHTGNPHSPTPTAIPGGQVITTVGLKQLASGQYGPFLLLDILGQQQGLPGAIRATPAAQAGSFQDEVQGQYGQFLQQMTQGKADTPIVVYCLSTECWLSYNAALRAINLGYKNVLWYRGGIEAWQVNGGQLVNLP